MSNDIVGILVANDRADHIGLVLESVSDIIDELIFVDDMSSDRTVDMVKTLSEHYGFGLVVKEFNAMTTRHRLWEEAVDIGIKKCRGRGWFFIVDPDVIVADGKAIKDIASSGDADEYWFRTLNLCGDMTNDFVGSMNDPKGYLFRSDLKIAIDDLGCRVDDENYRSDFQDRFLGWDISWLQYADKIFEKRQRWFTWMWNKLHGYDMDLTQYLCSYFNRDVTGEPSESYMKVFVMNRLRAECKKPSEVAGELGIDETEFRKKYMDFPELLTKWDCNFELKFDDDGDIIGREPDLMATSILEDSQIYQLSMLEEYKRRLDEQN